MTIEPSLCPFLGMLGINMCCYALNNPVNKVDPNGKKPGDLFDSIDEAAKDAALYMIELGTFVNDWEYATSIYSITKLIPYTRFIETKYQLFGFTWSTYTATIQFKVITKYTYKKVSTDRNPVEVQVPNAPLFIKRVAGVHSHPYVKDAPYLYQFSPADKQWSHDAGVPMYLLTPTGYLRRHDAQTNTYDDVFTDMPLDPVFVLGR